MCKKGKREKGKEGDWVWGALGADRLIRLGFGRGFSHD